jgi:DNA-binding MarR family transcriptional regulator
LVPAIDKEVLSLTGMPLSWYDVLLELAAAPDGRLRMSDLAERVVLSRTRISRLVEELVERGLIRKEGHPNDRRSAYAVITEAGLAGFRASAPVYMGAIERQFASSLSNEELLQLSRLLSKTQKRPKN